MLRRVHHGDVGRAVKRVWIAFVFLSLAGLPSHLRAQNVHSVPFTDGFIGTRGPAAGTANNVVTYATLGIARVFFIQNSATNLFELQGNDIPGTMRIVRTNGTTLDIPASANWRNSGGTTFLIGILPRPTSPITFTYPTGSLVITDGSLPNGSSVGGYVAAYTGTVLANGESVSGNAAQAQVLSGLNAYLSTVVSSRPAGPVTVNSLTTSSATPTITGSATLAQGENLAVVVNGVQYTGSSTPAIVRSGSTWSLSLTTPLSVGTYSITATITNSNGFTLSDATLDELVITGPVITVAGSISANDKVYDANTSATGSTAALTLVGIAPGDEVTIASVTFAFQSTSVGNGKTVVITGVSLAGANAARYSVSLTGAPTATADITPRELTIGGSFTAANKVFDGTAAATITANNLTLVGVLNNDAVALTGLSAAFADAAEGSGKSVSLSTVSLSGSAAANYVLSLAGVPTATADITSFGGPVTIAGTFTVNDRIYDGTTAATGNTATLTLVGVSSSADVKIDAVTYAFQTAAAASGKTVVITNVTLGGANAAQYSVDLTGAPTATATINAAPLTISGVAASNRVYDGTIAATLTGTATYGGLIAGENFTVTGTPTGSFANANAGTGKAVTVSGYTAPNTNYVVTQPAGLTANVTRRPLTIGGAFEVADKIFDGTAIATITKHDLTLVGIVSGPSVALTGIAAAFADAAVGNSKPVTLTAATVNGPGAANYVLSFANVPGTTASIIAAAPPSAPRNVVASAADGRVSVSWLVPLSAGCNNITGYVVEYSADEGRTWTVTAVAAAPTSTALSGLTNNLAYHVRVAAVNNCGTGAHSIVAGPVVPIGPARDGTGRISTDAPGTGSITTGGVKRPVSIDVVQDTIVRLAGDNITLSLRAGEPSGGASPVDSSRALQLEHGGWFSTSGSGFAPGTFATMYLLNSAGEALLLGTVAVNADGTFAITATISESLPAGNYTVQVNGIDKTSTPHSVGLGVEVALPPADLVLDAVPNERSPAAGDTITITLTVSNRGRGPAIDVVIARAFREPGFNIVKATPLDGTYNDSTQDWTIGRIEPAASARLLLTVIVVPRGTQP